MKSKLLYFKPIGDGRGNLISLEENQNIPFDIKRVYYIYDTSDQPRGFHAHKELQQVLICVSGSCKVLLDDGIQKEVFELRDPSQGLFVNKMIWREMYDFSEHCVLLVLANEYYMEEDYIRDYKKFIDMVRK